VRALSFMMVFILPSCTNLSPASDSFHVRNTPAVQTHFILEETSSCNLLSFRAQYHPAVLSHGVKIAA
jgi:hypothetical protein